MHYKFPKITHINDVLPAIEGRDEFIVAERDWGIVVNYMVSMTDTFPPVNVVHLANGDQQLAGDLGDPIYETKEDHHAAIRRECRGMLFHKDGTIMARRLHKFFNVNERDETQFSGIDWQQPHVILEKLDGSMITPVVTDAGIRWGTKMGITDVGMGAEEFVARNPHYTKFAVDMLKTGFTPIFEWCSRKQRIVVDYPEDRLVLIAVRNTVTGEYMSFEALETFAEMLAIDVVKSYAGTAANMQHLIDETRASEGIEGWIIRFDDGHMLKIKGDWYVRIHKTKDSLNLEKNVVYLLINEKMDDVKSFMLDADRHRVEAFETDFWIGINDAVHTYERYYQTVLASGLDRKRYAQEWMPTIAKQDSFAPQFVFSRFNGKDARELVIDQIKKNTGTHTNIGTQAKIDSVRNLWGGHNWTYHFEGDL